MARERTNAGRVADVNGARCGRNARSKMREAVGRRKRKAATLIIERKKALTVGGQSLFQWREMRAAMAACDAACDAARCLQKLTPCRPDAVEESERLLYNMK